MRIVSHERSRDGFSVTIEHPGAYTNGESRVEKVHVSAAALRGKTRDQVRQAIKDAVDDDPIRDILGEDVAAPAQTRAILEDRMEALFADWQRWKLTRGEAQARTLPPAAITALTNREDAAWARYVQSIQQWRTAP